MAKPIIAVDVDEVVSVQAPSLVAYSNQKWGTHLTVEDFSENWAEMWGIDHVEVRERRDMLDKDKFVRSQPPMDGALEVLKALANDYDLVITTSRHSGLMQDTQEWIDEHYPGVFQDIHFSGIWDVLRDGLHLETKADLLKKVGAHYLIDDQPKHCLAAAAIGIESLLYGVYPWNRDIKDSANLTRVRDWQEVKTYFDAKHAK